jgi:predicted transposase YbfD/YdcC
MMINMSRKLYLLSYISETEMNQNMLNARIRAESCKQPSLHLVHDNHEWKGNLNSTASQSSVHYLIAGELAETNG